MDHIIALARHKDDSMFTKGEPAGSDTSRQEADEPILITIREDAKGWRVGESGPL